MQSDDPVQICIRSMKSVNSIGNMKTVGSLLKNKKQFLADVNNLHHLGQLVVCIIHQYIYSMNNSRNTKKRDT